MLAVGLLRPEGLLCWPEGCFAGRGAALLAGSLAAAAAAATIIIVVVVVALGIILPIPILFFFFLAAIVTRSRRVLLRLGFRRVLVVVDRGPVDVVVVREPDRLFFSCDRRHRDALSPAVLVH